MREIFGSEISLKDVHLLLDVLLGPYLPSPSTSSSGMELGVRDAESWSEDI